MPQACNFIKKRLWRQVFSCEFCEILKNTFSCRAPLVAASIYDNLMKKHPGYQKDRLVNLKIYLASYWKYLIGQNVIGQNFCRTKFLVAHNFSQNLFIFVRLKIYFIFTWYYGHTQRTGQWYSKEVVSSK